jgi:hypothetical protein
VIPHEGPDLNDSAIVNDFANSVAFFLTFPQFLTYAPYGRLSVFGCSQYKRRC